MKPILSLAGAMLVFTAAAVAGPFDAWGKYRSITINTTATGGGANVSGAVANFPLLVRLRSTDTASGANVLADDTTGASLRFASADGETVLPHQIERWSATAAEIWVLVPAVAGNAGTAFRMYWDNDTAASASNAAAVFSTANGFQAVFHMNEGAGDTIRDATSNDFKGVPVVGAGAGSTAPSPVNNTASGQYISGAYRDFPGSTTAGSVTVGGSYRLATAAGGGTNTGALSFNNATNSVYTVSLWINMDTYHGANNQRRAILSKTQTALAANTGGTPQWHLRALALPNRFEYVDNTALDSTLIVDTLTSGPVGNLITTGQWSYYTFVRQAASTPGVRSAQVYLQNANGTFLDRHTANAAMGKSMNATETATNVFIGSFAGTTGAGTGFLDGKLDEVTFSNVARSTDWVKLSYETQKPGTVTAVALGETQTNAAPQPPIISYTTPHVYTTGSAISALNVSSTGGTVSGYAISPDLEAATGLAFNTSTGSITGTPDTVSPAANYTIIATGPGGADTAVVNITVNAAATVPGISTGVSGVAGNAQVTVSWIAPVSDGGATITAYTATASPGGATCGWTTGPLSCTVTGLANGTAYTFTVTATNSAGSGAASTASTAVTPRTVPGAPTAAAGTAGNAQISVGFTAPASDGGAAITAYTVTATPGGLTATGATSPIVVTGLTNGTAYKFTVVATNAAGNGAASDSSAAVTPRTLPGAPTGVTGTPGNAQVSVGFTAPASDGGAAITAYTVTATPGGATATGATSPIVVTGLTNGTTYTFTVTATNVGGIGTASVASVGVAPRTVAGAPTSPLAVAGNAQATVSWTAPAGNGGAAITSYVVRAVNDTNKTCAWTTGILSCTVTGLTNGTAYTFTVVAVNAAGNGAASTASAAVTPTGIHAGSQVIRVTNMERPYSFVIPEGAMTGSEAITLSISDIWGRTVWSKSIKPDAKTREIGWNGRTANGRQASAGMYVVRLSVASGGKSVEIANKSLTLQPR